MDGIPAIRRPAATRPATATATTVLFRPIRPSDTSAVTTDVAIPATPSGDPRARDRRAYTRARGILSDLALLQSGLLAGTTDTVLLRRLAESGPTPADDPRLADLLAHASLRAQVELARREPRP